MCLTRATGYLRGTDPFICATTPVHLRWRLLDTGRAQARRDLCADWFGRVGPTPPGSCDDVAARPRTEPAAFG
eukprot:3158940-Prymnesium_polylepis.2